jgi:hypothetical protein
VPSGFVGMNKYMLPAGIKTPSTLAPAFASPPAQPLRITKYTRTLTRQNLFLLLQRKSQCSPTSSPFCSRLPPSSPCHPLKRSAPLASFASTKSTAVASSMADVSAEIISLTFRSHPVLRPLLQTGGAEGSRVVSCKVSRPSESE